MSLEAFLHTIADSSNEIDRLTLAFVQRDIRKRGPAQRQLLRLPSLEVEARLLMLLRVFDYTQERLVFESNYDGVFVDRDCLQRVLSWRGREALPALIEALDDPLIRIRKIAVEVLVNLGDPELFPCIFQAMINDPVLKEYDGYVIHALAELTTHQHLDLLISTLIQGNTEQRAVTLLFLTSIKSVAAAAVLPLLTAQEAALRGLAAKILGTWGVSEAINALTLALHDPDADVRCQATRALQQLNAQQVLPALMEALHDVNGYVRQEAAETVKSLADLDVFEMSVAALQDLDPGIRVKAIKNIAKDSRAFEYITTMLQDTDVNVRSAATYELGNLGDPRAIEPFIAALSDEPMIREVAAYNLGKFGDRRAVEPLIAAFAASQNGDPDRALAPGLFDSTGTTRDMIIFVLGTIKDPRATETLIAAMDDPGSYIRDSAIKGLAKLGDQRAVAPLLKRLVEQHDTDVIETLVALGGSQAVEGLHRVLLDWRKQPEYVCSSIARALRTHQQPAPDEILQALHAAETPEERSKAAHILGASGDPQAFMPLLAVLKNSEEDLSVRSAAIKALSNLNSEQAVAPLITVLADDPSRIVRAQAALALNRSQQETTYPALLQALADQATVVRVAAVNRLQYMDNPQVIPALQTLITQEIARDDDLSDYFADTKYFFNNELITEWLPEEHAQAAINFCRA